MNITCKRRRTISKVNSFSLGYTIRLSEIDGIVMSKLWFPMNPFSTPPDLWHPFIVQIHISSSVLPERVAANSELIDMFSLIKNLNENYRIETFDYYDY
jgi:hypothetical protein